MAFFDFRCVIAFVISLMVLTRQFSDANSHGDSVIYEERPSAEILTKFLKVPWINLNSSWANKVTSTCRNDITTLFRSASAGEMWALRMLDAASKLPSGILTGNIRDLGMYDECIGVKPHQNSANIQGRHCMVSMAMPTKFVRDAAAILYIQKQSAYNPTAGVELNFAPSLCLPSSCGVEDIAGLVNASIRGTPELAEFEVRVAEVTCSRNESEAQVFSLGTILTISFLTTVVVFLFFCTVCDFVVRARSGASSSTLKTLAKFSLYTNAIELLSTEISAETMPAINGIRFLSMLMVLLGHRVLTIMIKPLVNKSGIDEQISRSWLAPLYHILPYALDTFLVLSGFLTAYQFLSRLRSRSKFNLLHTYFHRYLRLTPCLAVLILIVIFVIPYYVSAPLGLFAFGVTTDYCRKNWWTNLLYIQNFYNSTEMCLAHTWYLAVEMQLFWLCPIILYPLHHRPRLGLMMLSGLFIVSSIIPAIDVVLHQYSIFFNTHQTFLGRRDIFLNFYIVTYHRVMPYLIGIFLGYSILNKKRDFTKWQISFGWIFTCICIVFCFWNVSYIQPISTEYNVVAEASYASVGRLAWSLASGWILYACTQGHGGPITTFLSLPIFVPFGRLGYTMYLVSVMIQVGLSVTLRTAEFTSDSAILYILWSDLAVTVAVALILTLLIEAPVTVLEKILRAKPSTSAIVKHSSPRRTDNLEAMMRMYLDLTNGGAESRAKIETKISQPDFWRTLSADLTTFGKQATKTPAQWEKMWQDWKHDTLKSENKRETRVQNRQHSELPAQSETGITILEKELLIFLLAVSCSSDDIICSFKEAEAAMPQESQSRSSASQKGDLAWLSKLDSNPLKAKRV